MKGKKFAFNQELVKSQLDYDPETGLLTWKMGIDSCRMKGKQAGYLRSDGYSRVEVLGSNVLAHRLIYLWVTGKDPDGLCVDHINHDKSDNRWSNLRLATYGENVTNSKYGGIDRGIYPRNGSYRVQITKDGVKYSYTHRTLEEARAHRTELEKEFYGEFSCNRVK